MKGRGWQAIVGGGAALGPNVSVTSPLTFQTNIGGYRPLRHVTAYSTATPIGL